LDKQAIESPQVAEHLLLVDPFVFGLDSQWFGFLKPVFSQLFWFPYDRSPFYMKFGLNWLGYKINLPGYQPPGGCLGIEGEYRSASSVRPGNG
jgi:hypothetical protein